MKYTELDDNNWSGRRGYNTYYIPGDKQEARDIYREIKPQPQESPELSFMREVAEGEQLVDVNHKAFEAPEDGWKIKIERWAV